MKVWAQDKSEHVCTYAFIDEGFNVNLCSDRLAALSAILVAVTHVELVTSNATFLMKKKVQNLAIQGTKESAAFLIQDAFVVNEVIDVSFSIRFILQINYLSSSFSVRFFEE